MFLLMQSPDYSVVVENLTKKFGDFVAVDNISFEVKKGEVFGFLGPNGAGKSTTIRMLCGIIPPTSGQGTVSGYMVGRESSKIKSVIGYMSQKFSLYEDLTVWENLDFYSGVYPIPFRQKKSRIEEALKIAGLTDRRDNLTAILPGGLRQRLALVCSLLHRPEILFLDEPTAGVDPPSRRNFWDLIYQLSESGVTVFVTTHYMDEAEHCDRIALIDAGRLIEIGSPKQLKLASNRIIEIECSDWLRAFEEFHKHEGSIGEASLFGTKIHLMPKPGADEKIESILNAANCRMLSKREVLPSLEDVFVALLRPEKT
jgi:ABC-2 type transport system ATP-binding protein